MLDKNQSQQPLAYKIRPQSLAEFVGQAHLVGENKPLRVAIEHKHLFSFILWGPPGCGKTTLAKVYSHAVGGELWELSAVSAGKEDIKRILRKGRSRAGSRMSRPPSAAPSGDGGQGSGPLDQVLPSFADSLAAVPPVRKHPKILFLDEIHRFNKAQQDFLLPYVENGDLTLIGATTENPSFEVIAPLLSRCRVFVLNELTSKDMAVIIKRALKTLGVKKSLSKGAADWLIAMANGDARQAITMLDNTNRLYGAITLETLKNTLQSKFLRYDKQGDEHYNTISAFIKSMRAGQPDAALYYLGRMVEAGEDPLYIARRMVVFASEDIGLAQPTALVVANAVFRACETIGLPECQINLAHGVAYLCGCGKDRSAYDAYFAALKDVKKHGNLPIPLNIRNAPTELMRRMGYGKGYDKYTKEDLLPEKLKGKRYMKR